MGDGAGYFGGGWRLAATDSLGCIYELGLRNADVFRIICPP